MGTREDSVAVNLARRDREREASERYKGFVGRTRLKRVSNESGKCDVFVCEEEVQSFPISTSSSSRPRIGTCNGRILRCMTSFGLTSVIALPVFLASRFRVFTTI